MKCFAMAGLAALGLASNSVSNPATTGQVFDFVAFDGLWQARVDLDKKFSEMSDPQSIDRTDLEDRLGGPTTDCSTKTLHCLDIGRMTLAVPKSGEVPEVWSANGAEFRVTWRGKGAQKGEYVIKVTRNQTTYFSYSESFGVKSMTFRMGQEKVSPYTTYLAVGANGLFKREP